MAKVLLLLFSSVGLLSCYEDGGETYANQITCTQMASDNALVIYLNSTTPIPSHLVVALNGDDVDIDECETESVHSMRFNEDRTSVTIYYSLNMSPEKYTYYFQGLKKGETPTRTDGSIKTFNRLSCDGAIANGSETKELTLRWKPVHANGEGCGVTSFMASSQVSVE